jgi:hypothetical protein
MSLLSGFDALKGLGNKFTGNRYEDLMSRRGWSPVLWLKAVKCPCYSDDTGNPDYKDPRCGGVGYFYSQDLNVEIDDEQQTVSFDGQSVFTVNASLTGIPDATRVVQSVVRAHNGITGEVYAVTSISGVNVTISSTMMGGHLPLQSETLFISYVYLRDTGATLNAIITNVDYQKDFIPSSEWLAGDAIMTISGRYRMGIRDRIVVPEQAVRANELIRYGSVDVFNRSLERLRYKDAIQVMTVQDKHQNFTLGVDFTLGADATIIWAGGINKLPYHYAFNVKYTGNAASAVMDVYADHITVTLSGQTDGSASFNLLYSDYPTAAVLIAKIASLQGYESCPEQEGATAAINSTELMTMNVLASAVNVLGVKAIVSNRDRTQYVFEYMHDLAYSIFMKQGQVRRPDQGTVLPWKQWLRLWEHTDLFSNGENLG